ncbi:MAG: DNA-3-methyladenine glycosylase 2 [Verrucomicrobia bacterium]|nr:DNA-3-methyladenine glycosylase 2 [Verrucomicrobiota bacterium]
MPPDRCLSPCVATWRVPEYALGTTLDSGQAFRWRPVQLGTMNRGTCRLEARTTGTWEGVVGTRWVRLRQGGEELGAETVVPSADWSWLEQYLQVAVELGPVLATFPPDAALQTAVAACPGLRLLRQDPWECLASFILSSTKQIEQIRQIIERLCAGYGDAVAVPAGHEPAFAFPGPERLAACSEAELRACRAGFRAPYLLEAARRVAAGTLDFTALAERPVHEARAALMSLPGVGRKIADCVLLFAYGFATVFPVDVWVLRALRELYFPGRRMTPRALLEFSETHFGPQAGYAQQYLFHYMRRARVTPVARRPGRCCA